VGRIRQEGAVPSCRARWLAPTALIRSISVPLVRRSPIASVRKELVIHSHPDAVWAAVRDVGAAHLLFPDVLTDARRDGDTRVVTFANGAVVRELIVDIDDAARRLAYTVVEGSLRFRHHHASMEVLPDPDGHTAVVWITDVLPDEFAAPIRDLVEQGAASMKRQLEERASRR
jgi:hypothetical protein